MVEKKSNWCLRYPGQEGDRLCYANNSIELQPAAITHIKKKTVLHTCVLKKTGYNSIDFSWTTTQIKPAAISDFDKRKKKYWVDTTNN